MYQQKQLWGCILIGGKSSRMGRAKHLITANSGLTWLEAQVRVLGGFVERIILSGEGDVPDALTHLERVDDIEDAQGPLSGILAVMRAYKHVSWVISACDLPVVQDEAIEWLLDQRKPEIWGIVPRHPNTQKLEPLLAYYDQRAAGLFEDVLLSGSLRISEICGSDRIATPLLPPEVADSWQNCNTPGDIERLRKPKNNNV